MDLKSFRLPGTRLGHMSDKLACNKPLMNVSAPRQWLGRGATAAAGYQSVGPISKHQGGCQPPAGYLPYVPKNKDEYGHHLLFMPHSSAWKTVDARTQLDFWAHMLDILQVVAIHLGIC